MSNLKKNVAYLNPIHHLILNMLKHLVATKRRISLVTLYWKTL